MNKEDMARLVEAFYDNDIKEILTNEDGFIYFVNIDSKKDVFQYTDIRLSLIELDLMYKAFLGIIGNGFLKQFNWGITNNIELFGSYFGQIPCIGIIKKNLI